MPPTVSSRAAGRMLAASLSVVAAIAVAPLRADETPDPVAAFDALAETMRLDWQVPGLAVAVIRDGEVLLAKGYGVRELGREDPVGADTLFAAASTTKAMTAAALGMLVDEGRLGWDDPVRKHVPELDLDDATLADELTVRDLLTHHTGLPATDYLWYASDLDWPGILAKLALVERKAATRGHFEYHNVMYGLAGDVVDRVSGQPWAEFVRTRIFAPLGMNRTVPLGGEVRSRGDYVTPHSREDGPLATWETLDVVDPIPAAGSVWTSANDMAKWIAFLLDPASVSDDDGQPLVAPETIEELFRPQVVIQPGAFYPTAEKTRPHWTTYGLGWFQQDYRGAKLDFHTGSIDGLVAIVGLVRDERFGVAVFGNLDHAELRHALLFSAIDLFLHDGLDRDWNGELRAFYDEQRQKAADRRVEIESKRLPEAPPAHPLEAYAGTYVDPLFGELEIGLDGNALAVAFGPLLVGRAEPWHFETFRVTWNRKLYGVSWLVFAPASEGAIAAAELDGTRFPRRAAEPDGAATTISR